MEIADYLRAGRLGNPAVQSAAQRNGKYYRRVLASTLKELIADEMVLRKSYDEIPPRVEYSLTRKGRSVVPILQNICRWADKYYQEECDYNLTPCQRCVYK